MKPYLKIALPLGLIAATFITWVMLAYAACTSGGTTTTILSLCKPAAGETGWAAVINANYDTIDALFQAGSLLKVTAGGTGLSTAGSDSTKALMSNGAGGFVMSSPAGVILFGSNNGGVIAQTQTFYAQAGGTITTPLESDARTRLANGATFTKFYVRISTAQPNFGSTLTFTVMKNGVATAITKVINANDPLGEYSDTAHSATFAANDEFSLKVQSGAGATADSANITGWILQ